MIGIGRFQRVLKRAGAELVLHGHTHLDTLTWLEGQNMSVPVVGVPSASEMQGGKRPASGYNLITIDGDSNEWSSHLQRFGLNDDGASYGPYGPQINLSDKSNRST